jgi:hypothetical protein
MADGATRATIDHFRVRVRAQCSKIRLQIISLRCYTLRLYTKLDGISRVYLLGISMSSPIVYISNQARVSRKSKDELMMRMLLGRMFISPHLRSYGLHPAPDRFYLLYFFFQGTHITYPLA